MRDEVFKNRVNQFEFNENVANVFDDMVHRSIPNYHEIHKIISDLTTRFYKGGKIYDLGCSTGTTLQLVAQALKKNNLPLPHMEGVDNSIHMIEKARLKLDSFGLKNIHLDQGNIENFKMDNAGMIVMNYTLQFIDPSKRVELLRKIYNSLKPNGIFILAEKIVCEDDQINDLLIDLYYDFKRRNGYTEMEISNKREALENVMTPITPDKQKQMLQDAGFKKSEMIFRWYNFCCYIGIKQ